MSTLTINTDSSHLTMQGSGKVTIKSSIKIAGSGTHLPIECTADFSNIPTDLHQVYFDALRYQYSSQVSVHNNTEPFNTAGPEPLTIEEQKSEWRLNRIVDLFCNAIHKGNLFKK
jgi:hypothetical protein